MSKKVYRPILKEGDHLLKSKENPDRVRGLARDENNQNPDIIEWEEVDVDDLNDDSDYDYDYDDEDSYEDYEFQLSPEQEELLLTLGWVLAEAAIEGSKRLYRNVIKPWWRTNAKPWLKRRLHHRKNAGRKSNNHIKSTETQFEINDQAETDYGLIEVSSQIDMLFDQLFVEMDEEEMKEHMLRLVYHMLGVVNEIRLISNARIKKECETEELCVEKQREVEKYLITKVSDSLNHLLSDKNLKLDINTSKQLFQLTGGGIYINDEYAPVQEVKIEEALKSFKD